MTDLDGDTRDRNDLGIPDPTEHALPGSQRENRIQLFGTLALWTGAALIAVDIITVLALSAADWSGWHDPVTRQFAGLASFLIGIAAAALITVGGFERITRQSRALIRRSMARADRNAAVGHANNAAITRVTEAVEQNGRLIAEVIVTLTGVEKRLLALEAAVEAVPGYAEGLAKGAKVAASVLRTDID